MLSSSANHALKHLSRVLTKFVSTDRRRQRQRQKRRAEVGAVDRLVKLPADPFESWRGPHCCDDVDVYCPRRTARWRYSPQFRGKKSISKMCFQQSLRLRLLYLLRLRRVKWLKERAKRRFRSRQFYKERATRGEYADDRWRCRWKVESFQLSAVVVTAAVAAPSKLNFSPLRPP